MRIVRLSASDARRFPWRNGRGVTEEIALGPDGAAFERDDWDWRVSKASVPEAGPFSAFPGIDRVIVVTSGDGLDLSHGDAAPGARIGALVPYRFSGDWPTTAALVGGPVSDFNVMTRCGRATADVCVLRPGTTGVAETVEADEVLVHVLGAAGAIGIDGAAACDVEPGGTVWVRRPAGPVEVRARSDDAGCAVLVVAVTAPR